MTQKKFTIDEVLDLVETWLITGKLNPEILAQDFHFSSPFWSKVNRSEFIAQFADSAEYQKVALSQIKRFEPIIQMADKGGKYFAIILQYHTQNSHSVYETVVGTLADGLVVELRSIYDLNETKKALELI